MSGFTSKKFSAAEKHFQNLLDKERKRNKRLADDYVMAADMVEELRKKVDELERENLKLNTELAVAMDAAKLSPEDLKALVERSYNTGQLWKILEYLDGRGFFG